MTIFAKTISLNSGDRGLEIKNFIENERYEKADDFLILDDEIGDIKKQFEDIHIIHTNFSTGFDNEKLEESMKKINLKGGTKE